MAKYKIGDRVRIVSKKPEIFFSIGDADEYLGKEFIVWDVIHQWKGETVYFLQQILSEDCPHRRVDIAVAERWISGLASEKKAVNHPGSGYSVVLRFIGKTTTATLMHGDRAVKTAEAKCSPADQFQYGEGAKISVERLLTKKEKEPKKASREPKFGDKFLIIANSSFPPCRHFFNSGEVVTFVERCADIPNCARYINAKGLRQSVRDDCVKPYEGK